MSDTATPGAAPADAQSTAPVEAAAAEGSEEELAELEVEETSKEEGDKKEAKAKEEKKSSKKKYTPKVNGRQVELELDPENEEEMLKYLSKAIAADEKFQEAATLRKNVEQLVSQLKADPRAVLSHPELGIDLKKFAEDILNEEIEEMKKSPEQKELEKLRKELEAKTKREQELEEAKRQAEMERLQEQAFKQFDDDITAALQNSTLPKSPYVIKRIADTMIEAVNMGYVNASVQDILPIVEQQITGEIQKLFETMPEETMEKLIGKNNLSRLRKSRLAKMKASPETAKAVKETGQKSKEKEKEVPVKFGDIFGRF